MCKKKKSGPRENKQTVQKLSLSLDGRNFAEFIRYLTMKEDPVAGAALIKILAGSVCGHETLRLHAKFHGLCRV